MKEFLTKSGLAILTVFAPVKSVMISAMVLIMCDLVTGIMASRKRGEPVKSAGLQRTIVKLLVYESAIALGFIAQHYLMADAIPVCNILGSFVGLTELTSCFENLNELSGGQLLKQVLEKLGSANKEP